VKPAWASAASCALRTVVGVFERLGAVEPWQTVVIQGAGPLGLFATALARRAGARRIVMLGDPPDRLSVATTWGADHVVRIADFPEPDARVEHIREVTGGHGADIVLELSGARTAFGEGVRMVRRGGRYAVAGQVGPHTAEFQPTEITRNHLTILGSFSAAESEYWKAIQFLDSAQDQFDFDLMISRTYGLNDVNDAYSAMKSFDEIKPVLSPWADTSAN
jgi:L-iditol 2-dehydrogenase